MILAVLPQHQAAHADKLFQMHQLRYRVFHERLGWEVTTVGNTEMDVFDTYSPVYLLYIDEEGRVGGCARLLPTTGPTMLGKVFPVLLGEAAMPNDTRIWESSRFSVDTGEDRTGARLAARATVELFAGLCEFGLEMGWTHVATVTDLRLERLGARAGLCFDRFAEPRQMGKTQAVAGLGPVSTEVLKRIKEYGSLSGPVLRISDDAALRVAA